MKSRILLFLITLPIVATAHTINNISIKAILHRDGSASVTETRHCHLNDEGTEGFIRFYGLNGIRACDWAVSDETGSNYELCEKWNPKWSRKEKTNRCGVVSTGKGQELCWGLGSSGSRIFYISYTLRPLVQRYTDCDAFSYCFYEAANSAAKKASVIIVMEDTTFVRGKTSVSLEGCKGNIVVEDRKITVNTTKAMKNGDRIIVHVQFGKGIFKPLADNNKLFNLQEYSYQEGGDSRLFFVFNAIFGNKIRLIGILIIFCLLTIPFVHLFVMRKKEATGFQSIYSMPPYHRDLPVHGSLLRTYVVVNSSHDLAPIFDEISLGMTLNERLLCQAFVIRLINKGVITMKADHDGNNLFNIAEPDEKIDISDINWVKKILRCDDNSAELLIWNLLYMASGEDHMLQKADLKTYSWKNQDELVPMSKALHAIIYGGTSALSPLVLQKVYGFIRYLKDFDKEGEEKDKLDAQHWKELLAFAALLGYDKQFIKATEQSFPSPEQVPDYLHAMKEMGTKASWLGSDITDIMEYAYSVVEIARMEEEERRQRGDWSSFGGGSDSSGSSGGGGSGFR